MGNTGRGLGRETCTFAEDCVPSVSRPELKKIPNKANLSAVPWYGVGKNCPWANFNAIRV